MIQIVSQRGGMIFSPGIPHTVESLEKLFTALPTIISAIPPELNFNHYYTLAHHKGVTSSSTVPIRSAQSFDYQTMFAFDIDGCDTARAYDYRKIVADDLGIAPEAFQLHDSGNGIHLLLVLTKPITNVEYFKDNRRYYTAICDRLTQKLNDNGLSGRLDPAIFDPARVLRLPGTRNEKPGKPPKVAVILELAKGHYDLNLAELSGLSKFAEENLSPEQVKREYPTPDLKEMVRECLFVKGVIDEPQKVHEPEAFDFFSLMYPQAKESRIEHQGTKKTAVEIAKWVFDNAIASASLKRSDFSVRWEGAGRYGPRRCATINDRNPGTCEKCPHFGKIESPIVLKGEDHIGSAGLGYWVLDSKGRRTRPNYSDLTKVFIREHNILANEAGRFFLNSGKNKYVAHENAWVKALMERTVTPNELLNEKHRNEFIAKVKAVRCLSIEQEKEFFIDGIKNKLNYSNGILDLKTGEMIPYDPKYGFRYVLPHAYSLKSDAPEFMNWLTIMLNNEKQLIDTALDAMAYALWPEYDDHMFVMLTGEGRNGKSTFLNILQAVLGNENVSNVSLKQIVENRFAAAALDGKMANLSDEASGVILGHAELNILKQLSSGADMLVENKGQHAYKMKNTAKLFFSVNRAPHFKENSEALKRRMIVIPFNHTIENMDPNVERRLIEEAPGITNLLVQRMRENVRANGSFKVSRGNGLLHAAQQRMLSAYNSVAQWAEETVVHTQSEEDHITCDDAFIYYKKWCQEAEEIPVSRQKFTQDMKDYVLLKRTFHKQKRIDGRVAWIFQGLKFETTIGDMQ